jgi:hypothetical protein
MGDEHRAVGVYKTLAARFVERNTRQERDLLLLGERCECGMVYVRPLTGAVSRSKIVSRESSP